MNARTAPHRLPVAPNVLQRQFDGWNINRAWVSDITYLSTDEGWLYLAVVMDLASRRIVGWSMSDRLQAELVCLALKAAYWRRKPAPGLIMHSDRGSQYASDRYRRLVTDFGMLQSMSRRANHATAALTRPLALAVKRPRTGRDRARRKEPA